MVQENATFKEIILSSGSGYWIRSVGNEFATFILVDTHSLIYFFFNVDVRISLGIHSFSFLLFFL